MAVWTPKNWEEVYKRNAGRRKLLRRKRQARADRIVRLLNAFPAVPELRETSYGWLPLAAEQTNTIVPLHGRNKPVGQSLSVREQP